MMGSWSEQNPTYEYTRFSLKTAMHFLRQHYGHEMVQALKSCEHPATQADLFRLAYLNKMGGFYADADDRCRNSLDDLVESNAELVVHQEGNIFIGNNFIGCIPEQPMIQFALDQAVSNLLSYNNDGPWLKTGPGLLTTAICCGLLPYLSERDYRRWPKLVVLSQEELRTYVWSHVRFTLQVHLTKLVLCCISQPPERLKKSKIDNGI